MTRFNTVPRAAELPDDDVVEIVPAQQPPHITVVMPLFRQERFVEAAVLSVLQQRDVVCEIILSDDASRDDTLDLALSVVRQHGRGLPHSVRARRGTERLRRGHLLALVPSASTPIIAQAHGDDVSLPHRMRELHAALDDESSILAASPFTTIDEGGQETEAAAQIGHGVNALSLDDVLARPDWLIGSVQAWRPDRMTAFRPMNLEYAPLSHDRILPARAALLGGARAIGEPLVRRRLHRDNWTKRIVDTKSWHSTRHGWALARIMTFDVVLEDIDDAEKAGAISAVTADASRLAVAALRRESGTELRRRHADLLGRGKRLIWADEPNDAENADLPTTVETRQRPRG